VRWFSRTMPRFRSHPPPFSLFFFNRKAPFFSLLPWQLGFQRRFRSQETECVVVFADLLLESESVFLPFLTGLPPFLRFLAGKARVNVFFLRMLCQETFPIEVFWSADPLEPSCASLCWRFPSFSPPKLFSHRPWLPVFTEHSPFSYRCLGRHSMRVLLILSFDL